MATRSWAAVIGIIFLVVGILGLIPALHTSVPAGAPSMSVTKDYGLLFGLFPVNLVSDIFRIVIGLIGLVVSARVTPAEYYSRALALLFLILAFLGFVPVADTLNGLMPMYSDDTWMHVGIALISAYFGWVATAEAQLPAEHVAHAP